MNCSEEAGEEDHHQHDHDHDHDHDHGESQTHHTHAHGDPPMATTAAQSLYSVIDTSKLQAFNLGNRQSELPHLFKSNDARFEVKPVFRSLYGPELLVTVPFTGSAKVYSMILRTSSSAQHSPRDIRIFKNCPTLTLEDASRGHPRPTHVCQHLSGIGVDVDSETVSSVADPTGNTFVEHHFPRRKFTGTTSLGIFFANSHESCTLSPDEQDECPPLKIVSIEIRGEFAGVTGRVPVGIIYESAARKEDHPLSSKYRQLNPSGLEKNY